MKVVVKETEFDLSYTSRFHYVFEEKFNKSVDYQDLSYTNIANMLYACIIASIQKQKLNLSLNEDEYKDWLDDNGFMYILNQFALWLAEQIRFQTELLPKDEEQKEKKTPKKGKN